MLLLLFFFLYKAVLLKKMFQILIYHITMEISTETQIEKETKKSRLKRG